MGDHLSIDIHPKPRRMGVPSPTNLNKKRDGSMPQKEIKNLIEKKYFLNKPRETKKKYIKGHGNTAKILVLKEQKEFQLPTINKKIIIYEKEKIPSSLNITVFPH